MNPVRIEFDLGNNAYGQPVRLIRSRGTGGERVWIIQRDQANQRDDCSEVGGLTSQQIIDMAEAVKLTVKV